MIDDDQSAAVSTRNPDDERHADNRFLNRITFALNLTGRGRFNSQPGDS
jgi:hypothetical protein